MTKVRERRLNPAENKVNPDSERDFQKLYEEADDTCVCQFEM